VRAILRLNTLEIAEPALIDRDYWLKFSNSRKQWTLYCFSFFISRGMSPTALKHFLTLKDVAVVPLSDAIHKGLPVVENLLELLTSTENRERIVRHAVRLA
jgi:hypothetical protein